MIFKWIMKPGGTCPVQAEGFFPGYYFYFRSRWDTARIDFAESEEEWNKNTIKSYILDRFSDPYAAGYISPRKAKLLIIKGLIYFLLNLKDDRK